MEDSIEAYRCVAALAARPEKERNGKHGPGTGQMVFVVPERGQTLVYKFKAAEEPFKSDLKTALVKRPGGYVVEIAVPLADLGGTGQLQPGETMNLEIQLDDRDVRGGSVVNKYMTICGSSHSYERTDGYTRGTAK